MIHIEFPGLGGKCSSGLIVVMDFCLFPLASEENGGSGHGVLSKQTAVSISKTTGKVIKGLHLVHFFENFEWSTAKKERWG